MAYAANNAAVAGRAVATLHRWRRKAARTRIIRPAKSTACRQLNCTAGGGILFHHGAVAAAASAASAPARTCARGWAGELSSSAPLATMAAATANLGPKQATITAAAPAATTPEITAPGSASCPAVPRLGPAAHASETTGHRPMARPTTA